MSVVRLCGANPVTNKGSFTPRLGRIGDTGAQGARRLTRKTARTATRLNTSTSKTKFSGARIGKGSAVRFAHSSIPGFRIRRVIVKTHIARARGRAGSGAFRAHLSYLQRDGVERDGSGGELYTRKGETPDRSRFLKESTKDRHQFRFIVSAEDGHAFADLKSHTRALMSQMETDLGQRLDWLAVDHHNTGHPHTHIVVRGRDRRGRDIVIARNYLTSGLRKRAEEIATDMLGPRRDMEIIAAQNSDVSKDRLTKLDRDLSKLEQDDLIAMPSATGAKACFERRLQLQRLKHLEGHHLARRLDGNKWQMTAGWTDTLTAMGRRGDIIRSLSSNHARSIDRSRLKFWSHHERNKAPILGEVVTSGPDDELQDKRFLIVRDFEGTHWHISGGDGFEIPNGAVVEIGGHSAEPRPADRAIAEIASRHGGVYSSDLHASHDPRSSTTFQEAHKRRLEALRRAGIVERAPDGNWAIPDNYLDQAAAFENKTGRTRIQVRSWLSIAAQVEALGPTWLDTHKPKALPEHLASAREQRRLYLKSLGDVRPDTMAARELEQAAQAEANKTGQTHHQIGAGRRFDGKLMGWIDLGQGRMAHLSDGKEFVLVPWRRDLANLRGRALTVQSTHRGVSFSLARGRTRGLSR